MQTRHSGGLTGSGQANVHPVYRNMRPSKAAAIDKVVSMNMKTKGKASDIVKEMQGAQQHIKELSRMRGSRTTNSGDSNAEPKYRGARGSYSSSRGRGGSIGGGGFLDNLK